MFSCDGLSERNSACADTKVQFNALRMPLEATPANCEERLGLQQRTVLIGLALAEAAWA
jgi:hypothetical protein